MTELWKGGPRYEGGGAFPITTDSVLLAATVSSIFMTIFNFCAILFLFGALTAITERKNIHCSTGKKILYCFTFPLFMFTYIPISFAAFFCKGEWKPIEHRVSAASLRGRGREELLPF